MKVLWIQYAFFMFTYSYGEGQIEEVTTTCHTNWDCGYGGGCRPDDVGTGGTCSCWKNDQAVRPDYEGKCSKMKVDHCKEIQPLPCPEERAKNCYQTMSSFYCDCDKPYKGKLCEDDEVSKCKLCFNYKFILFYLNCFTMNIFQAQKSRIVM